VRIYRVLYWLFLFSFALHAQFRIFNKSDTSSIGYVVYNLSQDSIVSSLHADTLFPPASILKILSSACLIENFNLSVFTPTRIGYDGIIVNDTSFLGNLIIDAGGDPLLESGWVPSNQFLSELILFFKTKQIRTIRGNLILNLNHLQPTQRMPSLTEDDQQWWYAAPYGGFMFHINYCTATLQRLAEQWICSVEPQAADIKIQTKIKTLRHTSAQFRILWNEPISELNIIAAIPEVIQTYRLKIAVPDPDSWALKVIDQSLRDAAIHTQLSYQFNRSKPSIPPVDYHLIHQIDLLPLDSILMFANRESSNPIFEHLFCYLLNDVDHADQYLMEYFTKYSNNPLKGSIYDHSGLDVANSLSLAEWLAFFKGLYRENPQLWRRMQATLPIGSEIFPGVTQDNGTRVKTGLLPNACGMAIMGMHEEDELVALFFNKNSNLENSRKFFRIISQWAYSLFYKNGEDEK